MENKPWTEKDWRIRELLRSAESIKELFRVYWENREYILANTPELAKITLRFFLKKFCPVPDFRFLIWANEATYGLPNNDPVRFWVKNTFLDQIK
jgi:hypothetical protein